MTDSTVLPDNTKFLTLAYEPYHRGFWLRIQQVMSRISKQYPVNYINPPEGLFPGILSPTRWNKYIARSRIINENKLITYTPLEPIPFRYRVNWTNPLNEYFIARSIAKQLSDRGVENPILWMSIRYYQYKLENVFKESLTVYDVQDKHGTYLRFISDNARKRAKEFEAYACRRADVVITTHPEIKKNLASYNSNIHVIQNGIEPRLLDELKNKDFEFPKDIDEIPRPRLGYLGSIRPKVDFDCLLYLAEMRPEYNLVLIGQDLLNDPSAIPIFHKLIKKPNVYYLGPRPRELTSQYISAFDVSVYPAMRNDYCAHMDPNKVILSLAAFIPIVMLKQRIPIVHEDYIYLADSYNDFIKKVDGLLDGRDENFINKGRKHVETLSWDNKVEQILNILAKTYHKKYYT